MGPKVPHAAGNVGANSSQHRNKGYCSFLHVLPTPARTVEGWLDLLRRRPVTGGAVFDLQIAATMQANGIDRIYTFNTDDFAVFPELAAVTP
jgi:predicted nucleic acid-binding protein